MTPTAGQRYLSGAVAILVGIADDQWPAIRAAAEMVAETVAGGGLVHVFGTGHSHMLAEELFYRAGGLAAVNPILVEALMLHAGAEKSTLLWSGSTGLAEDHLRRPAVEARRHPHRRLQLGRQRRMRGVGPTCRAAPGPASWPSSAVAMPIVRPPRAVASVWLDLADVVIDNHGDSRRRQPRHRRPGRDEWQPPRPSPVQPSSTPSWPKQSRSSIGRGVDGRCLFQQQPGRGRRHQRRTR